LEFGSVTRFFFLFITTANLALTELASQNRISYHNKRKSTWSGTIPRSDKPCSKLTNPAHSARQ
jgi:hypothetical protein